MKPPPESRQILGVRVDATTYRDAVARICGWARCGRSAYVCCASVNNIMEAYDSPEFRSVMIAADLVTSDGMPLVWLLRWLGVPGATRVYGPDLMPIVLQAAAEAGLPVAFYGATEAVLKKIIDRAKTSFPRLDVAYAESPPFRTPTETEDAATTLAIAASGARIVFVGLNTPKQDRWMNAHCGRIPAVMLGVGAAFDFFAGVKPQAPRWMQRSGLEWLFRLCTEPRRLWRRYLFQNPHFAALALTQVIRTRLHEHRRTA
jgi:N-acetylglucosaminyldiphosphoundecaprenol N-acetyl-beta-D-mannosaminyltransferase